MDSLERNPGNLDSSKLSVQGNQLKYRGSTYLLRGTNTYAALPYHWSFNKDDMTHGIGNDGNLPRSMKFSAHEETIRFVKRFYNETTADATDAPFNCIRNPVSPTTFRQNPDPNVLTVITEQQRLDDLAKLDAFADLCAEQELWLMLCPYGMGFYGDYLDRRGSVLEDPSPENPDPNSETNIIRRVNNRTLDAHEDTRGKVLTAVETTLRDIRAWMKQRQDAGNAVGHILINTLNEPREYKDHEAVVWHDQQKAWIDALRDNTNSALLAYDGPIFIDGHQWANRLFVPQARTLAAHDSNVVFLSHRYADQPSQLDDGTVVPIYGNKKEWPGFKEVATATSNPLCVGVGEMGPSHGSAHLKDGVTSGDEFIDSNGFRDFVDEYMKDIFIDENTPIPVFLLWMVLHDGSSMFGYQKTTGVHPVLVDLFPDHESGDPAKVNNINPDAFDYSLPNPVPELNTWAEISKDVFKKSLVFGGSGSGSNLINMSGEWPNWDGSASGITGSSTGITVPAVASGQNMRQGVKAMQELLTADTQYMLSVTSTNSLGKALVFPKGDDGTSIVPIKDAGGGSVNESGAFAAAEVGVDKSVTFHLDQDASEFFVQVENGWQASTSTTMTVTLQAVNGSGSGSTASSEISMNVPWKHQWTANAAQGVSFSATSNSLTVQANSSSPIVHKYEQALSSSKQYRLSVTNATAKIYLRNGGTTVLATGQSDGAPATDGSDLIFNFTGSVDNFFIELQLPTSGGNVSVALVEESAGTGGSGGGSGSGSGTELLNLSGQWTTWDPNSSTTAVVFDSNSGGVRIPRGSGGGDQAIKTMDVALETGKTYLFKSTITEGAGRVRLYAKQDDGTPGVVNDLQSVEIDGTGELVLDFSDSTKKVTLQVSDDYWETTVDTLMLLSLKEN